MTSFYSLFMAIHGLYKDGSKINEDLYNDLLQELIEISLNANSSTEIESMRNYYDSCVQGGDSRTKRAFRDDLLKEVIIRFTNKLDSNRNFSETQKQLLWHRTRGHKCGICTLKIDSYSEMEVDHIERHRDGGLTSISNGRITHSSCNRSRG